MDNVRRNNYIDFLRALGLLLLIVAHTMPPEWLFQIISFDVPLMVFISAICYKPLKTGYFSYCKKRLKRIYIPVFIFLTLFFIGEFIAYILVGGPHINLNKVIGSYLLLNNPSIGYVWIMRVFLMMALVVPFIKDKFEKVSVLGTCIVIIVIVFIQEILIIGIEKLDNNLVVFILDEFLLYILGYSTVAILGLKIKQFNSNDSFTMIIVVMVLIALFLYIHDWDFSPQQYKYPPQSLYLLYGIFACLILWNSKSKLFPDKKNRIVIYLSKESMWLYLWHICPVLILSHFTSTLNVWGIRYIVVLTVAILINIIYHKIILLFPIKIKQAIE